MNNDIYIKVQKYNIFIQDKDTKIWKWIKTYKSFKRAKNYIYSHKGRFLLCTDTIPQFTLDNQ